MKALASGTMILIAALLAVSFHAQADQRYWSYQQQPGYFQSYQYSMPFQGPPSGYMDQNAPSFSGGSWSYGVSTREMPGGYLVQLALQGVPPSEVQMNVRDGALVFERSQTSGSAAQGSLGFGSFFWTLPLPADADVTRVTGRADATAIRIFIPKKGS